MPGQEEGWCGGPSPLLAPPGRGTTSQRRRLGTDRVTAARGVLERERE